MHPARLIGVVVLFAIGVCLRVYGYGVLTITCLATLACLTGEPLVALGYRLGRRDASSLDYLALFILCTLSALIFLATIGLLHDLSWLHRR
jgi:hypothetical protein